MIYRKDKYGNDISLLGFGCMRFTQNAGKINICKAESEIMEAYNNGVNYFDTAYIYPGSEAAIGEIFERNHIRENIKIASETTIGSLGEAEEQMYSDIVSAINAKMKVGCTGCGYCMPCPKNVDIPGTFAAYNRKYTDNTFTSLKEYFMCTALRKNESILKKSYFIV